MCIYIKIIQHDAYTALAAIVKVRTGIVQKWLGTNKFVRPESHTGSKFS